MNHTLHIPALEADCWDKDPGDEHVSTAGNQGMARSHSPLPEGSSPSSATTIATAYAEVLDKGEPPRCNAARIVHLDGDVLLTVHDRAGDEPRHSVVLFFTLEMMDALIEQAMEATDAAESFRQQRALVTAQVLADEYNEAMGRG